jgi:hypothetical protein
MHHAIVIGARCAGSPTSMLLARQRTACRLTTEPDSPATQRPPTPSIFEPR